MFNEFDFFIFLTLLLGAIGACSIGLAEWLAENIGYKAKHYEPRRRVPEDEMEEVRE